MNTPDYGHLLIAAFFLYGAVHSTFSQRLFGRAPHWPLFPWGGYPMSPFSRWLSFSVFTAFALWEIARGLFHLEPSLTVVAVAILSLISSGAAYRHDRRRRLAHTKAA